MAMARRRKGAKPGPKPKAAADRRSQGRTVKLTSSEAAAQDAAAAAVATKWATWAHDTLVGAAPPPDDSSTP